MEYCWICKSTDSLTLHGDNMYCISCVNEYWCQNDIDHCCSCNKFNINVTKYMEKTYCDDCIDSITNPLNKCNMCNNTKALECINDKLYCNKCATEFTKIKICDECKIRHIKEVCVFDYRYDSDSYNKYSNICNVCNRQHKYPNDCKYCEYCYDYVPLKYEHCPWCDTCEKKHRNCW